jgi:hypothetical protein
MMVVVVLVRIMDGCLEISRRVERCDGKGWVLKRSCSV